MGLHSKGQAGADLLLPLVVLFIFAVIGIFAYKVFGGINTQIQASTDFDTGTKATINNSYSKFPGWLDNTFVFVLGMFWLIVIIASFFIDTHPIMFIITLMLLVGTFVAGMLVSNAFGDIASSNDVSTETANLPMTTWVFDHLLEVLLGMGASILVALYAKR